MRIENGPDGLILKEVFNVVVFKTEEGEELAVCMRDGGFEVMYQNSWYRFCQGEIKDLEVKVIPDPRTRKSPFPPL